jgi:hypothetical protein
MSILHVYSLFLRELEVPGPSDLPEFQSLIASAQSLAGLHASSVIADAQSVLSEVASAVPSDLQSKIGEVLATGTPSSATIGASPNVVAGLALLNGAIGMAAGWNWTD